MSDATIAILISGVVTIAISVVGFLTLWVKLKYGVEQTEKAVEKAHDVENKLDDNTALTKAGTTAASQNAKVAATNAESALLAVSVINKKLNGGIDSAVVNAVKPIQAALEAHVAQDAKDLEELKAKLDDVTKYVHLRNHDILNALQTQSNNMAILMDKLEAREQQ